MMRTTFAAALALLAAVTIAPGATPIARKSSPIAHSPKTHTQVIVPGEDRFKPFSLTIRSGDSVQWINNDTDDHTVVSNDVFNTTGEKNVNIILPGTDSNGGVPGTFTLTFTKPGVFNYYCRFHSMLDDEHQPTAPGPRGGIQADDGNFGTPMMGVITVVAPSEGGNSQGGNN
jgi:plastocyanin